MVKITCLDGPWAGRTCKFSGVLMVELCEGELNLPARKETDPADLFASFMRHNWRWEADYSEATEEEKSEWQLADFSARIFRALKNGQPIIFLDKKYQLQEDEDLFKAIQRLEEEIIKISGWITIASDSENGLVIGSERIQ